MTDTPSDRSTIPSFGQVILAALGGALVGLAMAGPGVQHYRTYGAVLFLASPFVMGAVAAGILRRVSRPEGRHVILAAILGVLTAGGASILLVIEGVICLLMAFPLSFGAAALGALAVQYWGRAARPTTLLLGVLALPVAGGIESTRPPDRTPHEVLTTVEIDAPVDRIWGNVIAFPALPAPTEWWFRAGVAYPRYASIDGRGVGAVRLCVFSTGAFVEPITAWEPGRRLAFDVTESPAPMRELSPYADIHPPHLDNYLRTRRGEFRLTPLPGGRTRLEGRTWYELDMAPAVYWETIADAVIHQIHLRVLQHIKRESEKSAG